MTTVGSPPAVPLIGIRRPIEGEWVNIAAIGVHLDNPRWVAWFLSVHRYPNSLRVGRKTRPPFNRTICIPDFSRICAIRIAYKNRVQIRIYE
jgi:hypothetical protein